MQRYFSNKKEDNKLLIDPMDNNHIKNVMRMNEKDEVEIIYENKAYLCELLFIDSNIYGEIIKEIDSISNNYELIIAMALIKNDKFDWFIQKATELGVSKIIPIKTSRTIVKYDGKEEKKIERWQKIAKEAAEQSKRNDIPTIESIIDIKDLEATASVNLVTNVNQEAVLINTILNKYVNSDKILIVIGPEGGLSEQEVELLKEKGFKETYFGNNVLRAETAGIYSAALIKYKYTEV